MLKSSFAFLKVLLNKIVKFDANIDKLIITQKIKNKILILKNINNKYSLILFFIFTNKLKYSCDALLEKSIENNAVAIR